MRKKYETPVLRGYAVETQRLLDGSPLSIDKAEDSDMITSEDQFLSKKNPFESSDFWEGQE
jgi:hypothetical protein